MTAVQPAPPRIGMMGTALAHGVLVALVLVAAQRAKPATHIVYEVNLVAAPLPNPAVHNAAPEATPSAPEDVAPPVVKPKVVKAPPKPPPKVPAKHVDATPVTRTPAVPAPGERPSTGQDVVTLSQPGISFPYPEYLRNIENKIFAQWNHSMFRPGLDVQIAFVIMKDGSVNMSSVETTKSSRNSGYDLNARAAIEAAANARAFGPLPSGWNGASLPIIFDFAQVPRGAP
jgi:outer membrane biosynthesis protein TonB